MDPIYGWRLHLKPQPWWQPEVTTDLTEPVLEVKVTLAANLPTTLMLSRILCNLQSVANLATTSSFTHIVNLCLPGILHHLHHHHLHHHHRASYLTDACVELPVYHQEGTSPL